MDHSQDLVDLVRKNMNDLDILDLISNLPKNWSIQILGKVLTSQEQMTKNKVTLSRIQSGLTKINCIKVCDLVK